MTLTGIPLEGRRRPWRLTGTIQGQRADRALYQRADVYVRHRSEVIGVDARSHFRTCTMELGIDRSAKRDRSYLVYVPLRIYLLALLFCKIIIVFFEYS